MKINIPVIEQTNLKAKGIFYVGGVYAGQAGHTYMSGQMFVEVYIPKEIQHEYPLIFFMVQVKPMSTGCKPLMDGKDGLIIS